MINDHTRPQIGIFREVWGFMAYLVELFVPMSNTKLNIRLMSVVGNSIICGIEVFAFLGWDNIVTKLEKSISLSLSISKD